MDIDWGKLEYDPWSYRKCGVCRAEIGQPCYTVSGTVVNGRPDYVRTPLYSHAHVTRLKRTRKGKAYTSAPKAQ
jgi:hypothetical protein